MSNGIDLKGVSEVIAQFDYRETPFFFVYQGKDLKFFNEEDDLEAARALLDLHLQQLENNGSTAPFKIAFYKKLKEDGSIDRQSELGSNTFRVCQPGMGMQKYYAIKNGDISPEMAVSMGGNGNGRVVSQNDKIIEMLTAMDSRLTAIETPLEGEDDEDDIEPETNQSKLMGALAGIVSHPEVQQLLANKLIGLLNLIPSGLFNKPVTQQPIQQQNTLLNMNEQEQQQLGQYIQVLINAGMGMEDFKKLANIAQTNPGQFSMLLGMLKNQ
jgi:hypothetical protein